MRPREKKLYVFDFSCTKTNEKRVEGKIDDRPFGKAVFQKIQFFLKFSFFCIFLYSGSF